MSHRIPKTAAVVATAATAAFAAYAVGSQTNSSGQAGAHGNGAPGYGPMGYGPPGGRDGLRPGDHDGFRHDRGAMLDAFAKKLGVTTAKLQAALQSLRPTADDHAAHEDQEAQALADALNIDKAKVTAAFAKLHADGKPDGPGRDGPRGDMGAALAKELGVTTTELQAAFKKVQTAERDAFAQKLADKLGISVDKVKAAVAAGPFGGPAFHGPRMHK